MCRMRSIRQAAQMIRETDPDTCISEGVLRRLVDAGTIPYVPAGKKKLVNVDAIMEHFNRPILDENESNNTDSRRVICEVV